MYKFDKIVENVYNQQKSLETLTEAEGGLVGSYLNFVRNTVARRAKVFQKTLSDSNYIRGNVLYLKDAKTNFPVLEDKLGIQKLRTSTQAPKVPNIGDIVTAKNNSVYIVKGISGNQLDVRQYSIKTKSEFGTPSKINVSDISQQPIPDEAFDKNGKILDDQKFTILLYNTIDTAEQANRNYISLKEIASGTLAGNTEATRKVGQDIPVNEGGLFNSIKSTLKSKGNLDQLFYYITPSEAEQQQKIDESPGILKTAATGVVNAVGSEIGKALNNTSTTW